jgi:hypothetical protein
MVVSVALMCEIGVARSSAGTTARLMVEKSDASNQEQVLIRMIAVADNALQHRLHLIQQSDHERELRPTRSEDAKQVKPWTKREMVGKDNG